MVRLFIAIDLPERIRDEVSATYAAIPGAKWVEEAQIHLTLRFIGDVPEDTAHQIANTLRLITAPCFNLTLKGVGHFPPRKEPKVLWIGIMESESLMRLQSKIERALNDIGIPAEERKFHPHITVARLSKSPENKVAAYLVDNSLFASEPFEVSEFHLYSSILKREGALHIKEASFKLG